jgi:hypothetical protein
VVGKRLEALSALERWVAFVSVWDRKRTRELRNEAVELSQKDESRLFREPCV